MISKSLKRTLFIYLVLAFFITSILTIVSLLVEYNPSTRHALQRFGIGALVLNSILWSLLFTIVGSTSLLNQYEPVRNHFLFSLLCFLFLPSLAVIITLMTPYKKDMFGITEAATIFFIVQLFFFFRFRSCTKRWDSMVID